MRTIKFPLATLIALTMVACSTEDISISEPTNREASLSVGMYVSGKSGETRMTKDLINDGIRKPGLPEESIVKILEVWLFNPDGTLDGNDNGKAYKTATIGENHFNGALYIEDIPCTEGEKTLVVIANHRATWYDNKKNQNQTLEQKNYLTNNDWTLSELQAVIIDGRESIYNIYTNANALENFPLMMSAVENIEILPGHNVYGEPPSGSHHKDNPNGSDIPISNYIRTNKAPIPVVRVNARVALTGLTYEFDPTEDFDNFQLQYVAVFNAPAYSRVFASDAPVSGDIWGGRLHHLQTVSDNQFTFFFGAAAADWTSGYGGYQTKYDTPMGETENYLNDQWAYQQHANGAWIGENNGQLMAPHYYIYENTDEYPTLLVIAGRLRKGNTELSQSTHPEIIWNQLTFYTVYVNGKDFGYTYTDENGSPISGSGIGDGNVYRNTQYNLNVTLKGAGLPYVGKPEETKSDLDVAIEVADWEVVNLSAVF